MKTIELHIPYEIQRTTNEPMTLERFQQTVLPLKDRLFRLALRLTSNRPEAEDIVQEVFIRLWKKREDLANVQNLEAWAVRMTKNLTIDRLRSKKHQTEDLPIASGTPDSETPHSITERKDTLDYIRKLMDQLPLKQKSVMQLRDVEGYSYQEIAQALEMPMNQVKVYLFRARQTMKNLLIQNRSLI